MEWVIGESPTNLLSLSAGDTVDQDSEYSERHKIEAKRRLLDLVCVMAISPPFPCFYEVL